MSSDEIDERDIARIVRKECACVIRAEFRRHRMMIDRKIRAVIEVFQESLDSEKLADLRESFAEWSNEEMDWLK